MAETYFLASTHFCDCRGGSFLTDLSIGRRYLLPFETRATFFCLRTPVFCRFLCTFISRQACDSPQLLVVGYLVRSLDYHSAMHMFCMFVQVCLRLFVWSMLQGWQKYRMGSAWPKAKKQPDAEILKALASPRFEKRW